MRFGIASPLALFSECHARTLEQCLALRGLAAMLRETGWSTRAQQASRDILRHFDEEAVRNHAEEETCLFPALVQSTEQIDAGCLRRMTSELAGEHGRLERMWLRLRFRLESIADGRSASLPEAEVEAFIEANVRHIQAEETGVLPMAGRLIPGTALPRLRASIQALRA